MPVADRRLDSIRLLRAGGLDAGAARAIGMALGRVVDRLASAGA